MIKKILLAAALALPVMASAQSVKIGVVDTSGVLASLPKTAEAQKKLEATQKSYEEDYKKLIEEMNRKADEYNKMSKDELPAIRDRKTRELNEFQQKISQFEQNAQQDLQKLQNDLFAPIMNEVHQAIESVGKEGNFTIIQDSNPQLVPFVGASAINVTNDVKAKLGVK